MLDHFRNRLGDSLADHIPTGDQRPIGLVHHGETMLGSARHRDEARRLLEHVLQALAFGLEFALDPNLVRDLDNDRHDAGRSAVFAEERGVIEIEPDLLRFAVMPVKREREVSVCERPAGEPDLHDVVVEVGDLGPTLPDLGAEQNWVAAASEGGVAIVVDHDPVLTP